MKKVTNTKDTYKVNSNVTVDVKNKREEDIESGSIHYDRTVTIKIKAGKFADAPLTFEGADSLAEYIDTVNFEDPNESLDFDIERTDNSQTMTAKVD